MKNGYVVLIQHVNLFLIRFWNLCLQQCCNHEKTLTYWFFKKDRQVRFRSSPPEVFLRKGVLKICSKFTGEHPCRSVISIKLFCNFIEITLWHGCSLLNLLHNFRTPFPKNTEGGMLLKVTSTFIFLELGGFIN